MKTNRPSRLRPASLLHPVATIAAVIGLHAGCQRSGSDDHPVITYNCASNASEIAALKADLPAFLESTGIEVKLNPFSGEEKLYAMMAARQAPDIFYTNTAVRDRLAAEGRLLDLGPFIEEDPIRSAFPPHLLDATRSVDGGLYSLSNYTHTCGVYYDRAAFAAAGLEPPRADWTWSDLRETAARLTRDSDADGRTDRYGIFIPAHFIEMLEQMNHAPIHRNTLFLEISPEAREVHEKYLGLIEDGLMPDIRRVQALGMQAAQMLQSGRVAMLVEGVPHPGIVDTLTIDWGLAPLPRFDGLEPRYFRSDSGGLSISASTRHPEAAWRTLVWLINEASVSQPNPVLGGSGFVDAWIAKHPGAAGTGFDEVWSRSLQFPGGDPRYFVRFSSWTTNAIVSRLQPLLDQLWSGGIEPSELIEAVPGINRDVRRELDRQLRSRSLQPGFREALEAALREADASPTAPGPP